MGTNRTAELTATEQALQGTELSALVDQAQALAAGLRRELAKAKALRKALARKPATQAIDYVAPVEQLEEALGLLTEQGVLDALAATARAELQLAELQVLAEGRAVDEVDVEDGEVEAERRAEAWVRSKARKA